MKQQVVDQRSAARYLLKLKLASQSFYGFMDYYYDWADVPGFMREFQEVLDLLEKDALLSKGGNPIRSLLVNMPPRHTKSFNGTVNFPAYCLMRKPKREMMVSAYNNELATTFGRGTRDIVTDVKARKAFKDFDLSRETRAVDFWKTSVGGAYYGVGLNGTTTGRGANGLVVDDPYKSREEAESTTVRRKVWEFYTAGLIARLQPDIDGQPPFKIVTHTRWHPDDLAGRIMESPEFKRGEWLHLNFKALSIRDKGVYIRRTELPKSDPAYCPTVDKPLPGQAVEPGKRLTGISGQLYKPARTVKMPTEVALWPSRFPVEWLKKQKEMIGDREFSALYQQEPYVLGGNILKDNWFRRYTRDTLPTNFHALVIGADTASKTKTMNDYSVFTVGAITDIGDIYILRVYREKLEYPELKRKLTTLNATYRGSGLRGTWIEDASSGQALLQEMRNGSGVSVIPWKPGSADKVSRVLSITPLIEAGRVYIPEEADWLDEWTQEIAAFPSGKNDDQVDSLVITLDVLSRMVIVGLKEFNAPIGELVTQSGMADLMFSNQVLNADPNGWMGKGGLGQAAANLEWKGWGN